MKEILKQSSWLFLAQILTRIIGFFYTIFLARTLGVLDFGLYSVGLAYFSIISSLADFGFNRFLIREIAKDGGKQWELVWNLVTLRLTMICIFFAIFAGVLYVFDSDKMRVSIILLASLAVLPQAVAVTFDGIFIALRRLHLSAVASVIGSVSIAVLGFTLVTAGFGVFGAVNAIIIGQFIFAATLILLLYKQGGLKISAVKLLVIKKALLGSLPYGLLAILGLLYFRIDTILLSYMKGNFETGIYSAAYRFLEALVFIPNALGLALFPKLVKLHRGDPKEIRKVLFKSIGVMLTLGSIIAMSYFVILPAAINAFLPNYLPAVEVIKILSLAIPFMFIHVPAAQVLLSSEKYLKQIIIVSIFPLIFNVALNLIFIPKFGFLGASWVTVASDIFSTLILLILIRKLIFKNA